jgi:glycosyltransferase involved in cell wall biosynthesis
MPDISVIIPCFNQGHFLHEAIDSVLNQTFQKFEIIIVNDGSNDPRTIEIIGKLNHPKIKVLHTPNKGLSAARNNGIREAQADIILPLDSDDKIESTYLQKANAVMKQRDDIGIVTCNAKFFGAKRGNWKLKDYSERTILFENVIFCTSFFYRKDWETVKGYNSNMRYGWEDWDLWLSIISLKKAVYRIPEFLFMYRIGKKSMVHRMSDEQKSEMFNQLFKNHEEFYRAHIADLFNEVNRLQKEYSRPLLDRLIKDKFQHPFKTLKNTFRINLP